MWERIKALVQRLFGHKPLTTDREAEAAALDMEAYRDTAKTNIIAIACNKFATLSMADATFSVTEPSGGETKRTEELSGFLERLVAKARGIVSMGLGSGIVYVIPYNVGKKIYFDTATKDRAFITATQGNDITGLSVLADEQIIDHTLYQRWTDYAVSDGRYLITQKVTRDGQPISGGLSQIEEWRNIPEVVAIEGVERLPVGVFRCPTCGRRPEAIDGVPLCYGTEENISRIAETLYQIRREFELKQTFVGAENNMFDEEGKLPKDGLFKTFRAERKLGADSFWEIYDPAYRDSSLYNRLDHEFALFEKVIGASKGILTELDTANATATQVRRATIDTAMIVSGIWAAFDEMLEGALYGANMLCNYAGSTPQSEYKLVSDYSYILTEDPEGDFARLKDGKAMGVIEDVELRQWLRPNETAEEAKEVIERIKRENPSVRDLIGE